MPERFYQASMLLNTYGPRLKNCRGDEKGAIETFRSDDLLFRHSRNLLSGIHVFAFSFGI